MKTNCYVEFNGKKKLYQDIIDEVKEIWKAKGGKVKDINTVDIYFKPEEDMCYYVINEEETGSFHV